MIAPISTEDQLYAAMTVAEREHLEFKAAQNSFASENLFRYCVALSNEGGGNLILGVTDRPPRRVVGTNCFHDLNAIKTRLLDTLKFRVDVFEIATSDGRVLAFHCPGRPIGTPRAYKGRYLMRSGESLVSMTPEVLERMFTESTPDYSQSICEGAVFADLAPEAIAEFRARWVCKSGNHALAQASDAQLLEDAHLTDNGRITYAAMVLLGRAASVARLLPQAELVFEYRSSEASIAYQDRAEYRAGFFVWGTAIWDKINARNEKHSYRDGMKTRMKEAWCYLIYPVQESAQSDVEWMSAKVPAQDGLLARASKKLVSDQGIWPELGPDNLNRQLEKYIWNGKPHLHLKDLWEYLNRYTYLPRVKNRAVLSKAVHAAVSGMLPGPFAYAERWDETKGSYVGLAISSATSAQVVIDSESVIIKPDVAEQYRQKQTAAAPAEGPAPAVTHGPDTTTQPAPGTPATAPAEQKPTRFHGTVMISPERPARDIHQIVEAIIEQLTTLPGADVSIKLEIDAEVSSGLDRAKVRTLVENATTLGFIDKLVK